MVSGDYHGGRNFTYTRRVDRRSDQTYLRALAGSTKTWAETLDYLATTPREHIPTDSTVTLHPKNEEPGNKTPPPYHRMVSYFGMASIGLEIFTISIHQPDIPL